MLDVFDCFSKHFPLDFNPFETKSKVMNQDEPLAKPKPSGYDLDKFDDPNFNPFETKTKVKNEEEKLEDTSPIQLDKTQTKKGKTNENKELTLLIMILTENVSSPETNDKIVPNLNMSAESGNYIITGKTNLYWL